MDLISALGLSSASGLNAYIPLVILGALDRWTDVINLPAGWDWLSSTPALIILAVLLIIEVVADKIPALDSMNDVIQTLIRPASGGIVFSSGLGQEQVVDGSAGFPWGTFIVGVVIALVIHLLKSLSRPAANVSTAGIAAPALSTGEDVLAIGLSLFSIYLPILVLVLLVLLFGSAFYLISKVRRAKLLPVGRSDTSS
ncbi:MAG: DUF4126 domain-containing protein [Actinomycetaceae bacterium]|nr:DUF4126 domain-containing protein [Actinomycetaceae bacterium]